MVGASHGSGSGSVTARVVNVVDTHSDCCSPQTALTSTVIVKLSGNPINCLLVVVTVSVAPPLSLISYVVAVPFHETSAEFSVILLTVKLVGASHGSGSVPPCSPTSSTNTLSTIAPG